MTFGNAELLERWEGLLRLRDGNSRGLIIESRECPFDNDHRWLPQNLRAWNPLVSPETPASFDVLVLRDIVAERFVDDGDIDNKAPAVALDLLRAATTAVRRGVPILVHTPDRFALLKKPATTAVSPFRLDVTRFLALEELVYLLQIHCELPVPATDPTATALYLTPIERRLAEALTAANIEYKVQVPIRGFIVDFLIDDQIVVECDGEAWHDPAKDELRDVRLRELDLRVIRFTGRAIHRDAASCVARVKEARSRPAPLPFESKIKMTDAQRRAASHIDGPALVVAPAGSGKTRVIEERVRWLVAAGVEQSRICVLSFTNAAVGEVKDRLESYPNVSIRTLSSFANEVVRREEGEKVIIENNRDPRVPTPTAILQRVSTDLGYRPDNRAGMWKTLREAVGNYRGSFVLPNPDELGLNLPQKENESTEDHVRRKVQLFHKIHDAYQDHLRLKSFQDFDGQIIDAIRILSSKFQVRLEVSQSYDYWLIDEFQDLAPPKILLARLLVSPARNLMVVGDDDQIIYGFAGAKPQSFSVLDRDWCDVTALPLDTNFRSPHEIVVRTRWMIERNKQRIPKNTTPFRELQDEDCVIISRDPSKDYATAAVEEYERLRRSRPASDFVFLFRTSMAAAPVELLMQEKGIPYVPLAKQSILYNREVQWVLSWLRVINDPNASRSDWESSISRPTRYFTRETVSWLASARDPFALIRESVRNGCTKVAGLSARQTPALVLDQFRSLERAIDAARRFPDSLEMQLRQLDLEATIHNEQTQKEADKSGLNAQPQGDGKSVDPKAAYGVIALLASLAGTWPVLTRFIERASEDPDIDMTEERPKDVPEDSLRLLTIHGFKGRECPIVFVLGPRDGYMPDRRAATPAAREEERRVAYVAATRARERLYFWCSDQYEKELSVRDDGLTWDMYKSGLSEPPRPPQQKETEKKQKQTERVVEVQPVRESQPGLLESALKWIMKKLFNE